MQDERRRLGPEDLDDVTLLGLVRARDPVGVLSIYLDADPVQVGRPGGPTWEVDLRNRLAELERRIEAEGPRERAQALRACLERLAADRAELVDPRASGRGRALFAPLGGGAVTTFASRMRLPTRVVLDASPFIHPLLELLDEGRAAGVVLASHRETRVLEWRLDELSAVSSVEADDPRALRSPPGPVSIAPAGAGGGRHSSPAREERQRRELAQRRELVGRLVAEIGRLVAAHGWERVLVAGDDRLVQPLLEALPAPLAQAAIADRRQLDDLEPAALAAAVSERLRDDRADRELRLVQQVRERALGHAAGAVGLSEVLAALNESRVAHLVYDPEVRYRGQVGADGRLYTEDEAAPAGGPAEPEPRLTERLVERCLETGVRITPVEGASATALAEAGGIGALLRY